jgi:hypothetical protein
MTCKFLLATGLRSCRGIGRGSTVFGLMISGGYASGGVKEMPTRLRLWIIIKEVEVDG